MRAAAAVVPLRVRLHHHRCHPACAALRRSEEVGTWDSVSSALCTRHAISLQSSQCFASVACGADVVSRKGGLEEMK